MGRVTVAPNQITHPFTCDPESWKMVEWFPSASPVINESIGLFEFEISKDEHWLLRYLFFIGFPVKCIKASVTNCLQL